MKSLLSLEVQSEAWFSIQIALATVSNLATLSWEEWLHFIAINKLGHSRQLTSFLILNLLVFFEGTHCRLKGLKFRPEVCRLTRCWGYMTTWRLLMRVGALSLESWVEDVLRIHDLAYSETVTRCAFHALVFKNWFEEEGTHIGSSRQWHSWVGRGSWKVTYLLVDTEVIFSTIAFLKDTQLGGCCANVHYVSLFPSIIVLWRNMDRTLCLTAQKTDHKTMHSQDWQC